MATDRTLDECTLFDKEFRVSVFKFKFTLCNELWYNDIPIRGGELGIARSYSYFAISKITHPDLECSKYSIIIFGLEIWITKYDY